LEGNAVAKLTVTYVILCAVCLLIFPAGMRFQEFFTEMEKQAAEAAKQASRRR
jgi:hypothetical protein